MDRFFIAPERWDELRLEGDEAHHCLRVMRKAEGDEVEVFDGAGRWARGTIAAVEGESVVVAKDEEGMDRAPVPQVTLCVAIPKGKTMELIVQKAVELGVARIQPLVTERTVVRVDDAGKKRGKWQRVALEACKQCGQNLLPVVELPRPMGAWLPMRFRDVTGIVASLAVGAQDLRTVLRDYDEVPPKVELLVGPEGDFTEGEVASAVMEGFTPVSLGEIVLRVETAAIYALSALRYEFGGR